MGHELFGKEDSAKELAGGAADRAWRTLMPQKERILQLLWKRKAPQRVPVGIPIPPLPPTKMLRTLKTSFRHHRRTRRGLRSTRHNPTGATESQSLVSGATTTEEEPREGSAGRRSRVKKQQLAQLLLTPRRRGIRKCPGRRQARCRDNRGCGQCSPALIRCEGGARARVWTKAVRARWCYRDEDRFDRP